MGQQNGANRGGIRHESVACRNQIKHHIDTYGSAEDDREDKNPTKIGLPLGLGQLALALPSNSATSGVPHTVLANC